MSSPFPTGLQEAYRRMGVKSGILPGLDPGAAFGVVVLADYSRTIGTEPLEARGAVGFSLQAAFFGVFSVMELLCSGPGGLVIERVSVRHSNGSVSFAIGPVSLLTPAFVLLPIQNVGGSPVQSAAAGDINVPALPAGRVTVPLAAGAFFDFPVERIYVPPGNFFSLSADAALPGGMLEGVVFWRELAAVQSSP